MTHQLDITATHADGTPYAATEQTDAELGHDLLARCLRRGRELREQGMHSARIVCRCSYGERFVVAWDRRGFREDASREVELLLSEAR